MRVLRDLGIYLFRHGSMLITFSLGGQFLEKSIAWGRHPIQSLSREVSTPMASELKTGFTPFCLPLHNESVRYKRKDVIQTGTFTGLWKWLQNSTWKLTSQEGGIFRFKPPLLPHLEHEIKLRLFIDSNLSVEFALSKQELSLALARTSMNIVGSVKLGVPSVDSHW